MKYLTDTILDDVVQKLGNLIDSHDVIMKIQLYYPCEYADQLKHYRNRGADPRPPPANWSAPAPSSLR